MRPIESIHHLSLITLISLATLLFESTLTRLLAVTQFYHFAFLVVSLALLGYGASGTILSIFPGIRQIPISRIFFWIGIGFVVGVIIVFVAVNWLPFDSYSIAWERRQIGFFVIYYFALTIPFLVSGLGIGAALSIAVNKPHFVYAANLIGSALGALAAPWILSLAGVPGSLLLSACLGLLVAWVSFWINPSGYKKLAIGAISMVLGLGLLTFGGLVALNRGYSAPIGIQISPYKGLSYSRQIPGVKHLYGRWNATSRVDVVANAGTRRMPGLSYQYLDSPPPQLGLSVDGDALQPITLSTPEDFRAAAWLPEALAYELIPGADVLVLNPRGGLGVMQALSGGASTVTTVLENNLIIDAVSLTAPEYDVFSNERVELIEEPGRCFLKRSKSAFDLVVFPLTDAYRPVTSGAYSLAESYLFTVESFEHALQRLNPEGVLVVTRWLQSPPSESVRLISTLVEALERQQISHIDERVLAYRGIQTMTVLVKPSGWTQDEMAKAGQFFESRRFDWVWAPNIRENEVNRFNHLPAPEYFYLVREIFTASNREDLYKDYPYQIGPIVDNRPFFFHFFTRGQTTEVLQSIGHTWQPFGGSGYLILFALLAQVLMLSFVLILFPLVWKQNSSMDIRSTPNFRWRIAIYFSLLGVAFLFVEIPLIQRFILIFGQPIYAFAVVVTALLTFSGIGSMLVSKSWAHSRMILGILAIFVISMTFVMDQFLNMMLSLHLFWRIVAGVISLIPIGLLMGMPFPMGLLRLEKDSHHLRSWAWAINGCASVIASVLAAILTLSYGFNLVMVLGAVGYLAAGLVVEN